MSLFDGSQLLPLEKYRALEKELSSEFSDPEAELRRRRVFAVHPSFRCGQHITRGIRGSAAYYFLTIHVLYSSYISLIVDWRSFRVCLCLFVLFPVFFFHS